MRNPNHTGPEGGTGFAPLPRVLPPPSGSKGTTSLAWSSGNPWLQTRLPRPPCSLLPTVLFFFLTLSPFWGLHACFWNMLPLPQESGPLMGSASGRASPDPAPGKSPPPSGLCCREQGLLLPRAQEERRVGSRSPRHMLFLSVSQSVSYSHAYLAPKPFL